MKTKVSFIFLLSIFLACGCSNTIYNQKVSTGKTQLAVSPGNTQKDTVNKPQSNVSQVLATGTTANTDKDIITHKVYFSVIDENEKAIEGAEILLIDTDGNLLDKIVTDNNGEAVKGISLKIDKRFDSTLHDGLGSRGTVTAIINKIGYINVIVMEVPVSESGGDRVYLKHLIPGGRNEPEVILANNHHLEILSFFNIYSKYFNEK